MEVHASTKKLKLRNKMYIQSHGLVQRKESE